MCALVYSVIIMEHNRNKLHLFNKLRESLTEYLESCGIEIPDSARNTPNAQIALYLQAEVIPYLRGLQTDWDFFEEKYSTLLFQHKTEIDKVDKGKVKRYILAMCDLLR